ncbi:MAG: TetR/AcrR family transcriptional regulator [Alphaproteobacteria bacterium]|nr:TetR/AcrR family transcriptional regulator [Alphaproteobacteria bacterium]
MTSKSKKIPTIPHKDALPPRERILVAACDLFYNKGLHAVGVDAIAAAADTNKMTLYRHFASKDELIAAYLRKLAEEADAMWKEIEKAHKGDPKGHIVAWLELFLEPMLKSSLEKRGCAFANAAAELPDKNHPGRRVIEEYKNKCREDLIRMCKNNSIINPEQLADELFLLYEGVQASIQNIGLEGPASRFIDMVKIIIDSHTKPNSIKA